MMSEVRRVSHPYPVEVRSPRLHESVTIRLAGPIVAGEIRPGDLLPSEMSLAARFSVSRTVIREALKVLASKGMVEILHGQGVRVLPETAWSALDPLILAARERQGGLLHLLQDLLQVRRIVETEMAALAAQQATDDEVAQLQRILARMETAQDDLDAYNELDLELHAYLAAITHNRLLPALLRPISDLLAVGRHVTLHSRGTSAFAHAHHREIVDAVAQRDSSAARAAMERHLRLFEDDIRQASLSHEGSLVATAMARSATAGQAKGGEQRTGSS
jgi:DNA-binding FadR family transcriptional regulator